jgi:hypothetical protein
MDWLAGNPAPEGRPSLAQRFSAGKSGKKDSSPGGKAEFSRTLFRPFTNRTDLRVGGTHRAGLLQLGVFSLDLLHGRKIGVGVFPEAQNILIR